MSQLPVAFVSHYGPLSQARQAWLKLRTVVSNGPLASDRLQLLGVVYDDPVEGLRGSNVRYDACATVTVIRPGMRDVGWQVLPEAIGSTLDLRPAVRDQSPLKFVLTVLKLWSHSNAPLPAAQWAPPYRERYESWSEAIASTGSPVSQAVVVE